MSYAVNPRRWAGLALLAFSATLAAACAVGSGTGAGLPPGRVAGLIEIRSNPSGARIIVDGSPTGFQTPTAFPLPAGEHRITLSLAAHRSAEERVHLGPGDALRIEAILAPLAAGGLGVSSIPPGAQILIDGEPFDQRTPAVIPQLAIGTHTVQLRREGSEDWSQAVVVAQDRTVEIQALLAPSRNSLGTLAVQSQPPRAAISLDGCPSGRLTPEHLLGVPPGSHQVGLALDGYRHWSGTAVVRAGHTENLLVTLRPLPAPEAGSARIETDPPGASITLDGVVLRTKTPAKLERLAPGAFPIGLARPGSRSWSGELAVLPGACALLQVRLEPESGYGGSIRVTSEPPGAAVSIDGLPTAAITPCLLPNLAPSGHRVEAALAGFRPWQRVVQVGEGTMETVHAQLAPQPYTITASVAAARDGEMEIVFSVAGNSGAPAPRALELGVGTAAGAWRETAVALVEGVARTVLAPAPDAREITVSVGFGSRRDLFRLRRAPGGWELISPE